MTDLAMHNLFFGAYPDEKEAAEISALAGNLNRDHRLGSKPIDGARLHMTLVEFTGVKGMRERDIIDKAAAAGAAFALPPFDVQFDRVLSFTGRNGNPLVLAGGDGVAGALALQRALIKALHGQWLKIPPNPGYTPHMTLLYSKQMLAAQSIPPVRWRVREFALVYSHAGKTRHEILARWPLLYPLDAKGAER